MPLQDVLNDSFSGAGFDLGKAVEALSKAYTSVAPPGLDFDPTQLASLASQIGSTDPASAFSSVTDLAGRFGGVLGGIGSGADLIGPITTAVDSLGTLSSQGTDLKAALISALTTAPAGERPVDRFAAAGQALGGLQLGPLIGLVRTLASGALPSLPSALTGWAGPIAKIGGLPVLATQLGLLLAGSTVVARCGAVGGVLTRLADPAALDAARTSALALDGAVLAARVSSADPEDDIVAAVTAGLAPVIAYTDLVGEMIVGSRQLVDFVDVGALPSLLAPAATAAGSVDTSPIRALAEAVNGQLTIVFDLKPTAPAAASVAAFADFLAGQVQPLVDAVVGVDLALVTEPIDHATQAVLGPIRAVTDTLHTAVETIKATLETIRDAIDRLGLDAVVHAVHTVIDPVVAIVDQARRLLDPIAVQLGNLASQTSATISQLRASLDTVIGPIRAAFEALRTTVDSLHLDQLAGVRTQLDEVAAAIEGVSIGTAVDEAVGLISSAADVIGAIPLDLLPDSTKAEVASAVAPIRTIDFDQEVTQPLSETLAAALGEVEGPALDELTQAAGQVAQFLARIDPRPVLETISSEGFGAFVSAVQAIDPDVILAPIKDALSGLGGLGQLLDPADAVFDEVLTRLNTLDPAPLLEPIAQTVDELRTGLVEALALDRWVVEINTVCDQMLEVTKLIDVSTVLDLPLALLDQLWPADDSPSKGMAGAQLMARMLGPAIGALDVLSFAVVGDWISGRSGPAATITSALDGARSAIAGLRTTVSGLDPDAVLPTVGPAFDQVAAAIAALPDSNLKGRLSLLVARTPAELLQPALDGRADLLTALDAATSVLDQLGGVSAASLGTLADALRAAFSPLTDPFRAWVASWTVRMGADPAGDLRAALAGALTVVSTRLRTEVAALQAAVTDKLTQAVQQAIRTPLTKAAADIVELVATIDLHPLTGEIEALFGSVRDPFAALRPSTALADLVTAIDGLVGQSAAWDPFRDVRGPLNQLKTDLSAAAGELDPKNLFAPILSTYDTITAALAAIDVAALFERTLAALHALQSDVEDGLAAAGQAFGGLQDALPAA